VRKSRIGLLIGLRGPPAEAGPLPPARLPPLSPARHARCTRSRQEPRAPWTPCAGVDEHMARQWPPRPSAFAYIACTRPASTALSPIFFPPRQQQSKLTRSPPPPHTNAVVLPLWSAVVDPSTVDSPWPRLHLTLLSPVLALASPFALR
jgi:hypothetical protein